jgi:hypothetical protein
MRLFHFTNGRLRAVCLSSRDTAAQIEEIIRLRVQEDGGISALCLDFSGTFVPLADAGEVRLAAALLAAHCADPETTKTPAHGTSRAASRAEARAGVRADVDEYYIPLSPEFPAVRLDGDDSDSGSDSADEKETRRTLSWEFEQHADIDATPNFGKTGIKLW